MNRDEMKAMMGMNSGGGSAIYKLNKIEMSGDNGSFKLTDLITEREKGAKPNSEGLGDTLEGVILKMRWKLSRYEESGSLNSTEYDDKWKDTITVYPLKDKGSVPAMKEKYKLATQRIVYFYVPAKKEVVRLVVKSSALSADDKNPNGELGLFDYIDEFAHDEMLPCQFITICKGVFREGKNADGSPNKRKDHFAMSFSKGRQLTDVEFEKIQALMIDVNEKTNAPKAEEMPSSPDEEKTQALSQEQKDIEEFDSMPTKQEPPANLKGRLKSKEEIEEGINTDEVPF